MSIYRNMKGLKYLLLAGFMTAVVPAVQAQTMSVTLSVHVESVAGDDLTGQPVEIMQTDFSLGYGTVTLDAAGNCSVSIYPGNHTVSVDREGFLPVSKDFSVAEDATTASVELQLQEKTRDPYALTCAYSHDIMTGRDDVTLSWNVEAPALFDDFESYSPFAISFGGWTGIDGDNQPAGALVGSYPNRGVKQYAQIINPLEVQPTWWYDYPVLRPYSGHQYVGFTRTESGSANDDWLISPAVEVKQDYVLQFMAKAADLYDERFNVYVTTVTENPDKEDFVRISGGNYESVNYKAWRKFSYDLEQYAGQRVKFAIRYLGDYERYRSFMLMLDDFYVGQPPLEASAAAKAMRSPANPNETFNLYLDGVLQGTTDGYAYTFGNIAPGHHTLGVEAVYRASRSKIVTTDIDIDAEGYAKVNFSLTANSILSPDKVDITLLQLDGEGNYTVTTAGGTAAVRSLPCGRYTLGIGEGAYRSHTEELELTGDRDVSIVLEDNMIAPFNITATAGKDGRYTLTWNRDLGFNDSFEDYEDFACGEFGTWKTIDADNLPVYPIALGNMTNIVSFPGSGTASNPTAIPPMVFNPYSTTPAMLPDDPAIQACTGDKFIIFFSPQRATADKWLISEPVDIHEGYEFSITARAYAEYPESIEMCVSESGDRPSDFRAIAAVPQMPAQWMRYSADLSAYNGKTVRLAIHYTSTDAFMAQIDDFCVGPREGEGDFVDYGNIIRYEITLDGTKVGETTSPEFTLPVLEPGIHKAGVCAVYRDGRSDVTEYTIIADSGITDISGENGDTLHFDMLGRRSDARQHGVTISTSANRTVKILK